MKHSTPPPWSASPFSPTRYPANCRTSPPTKTSVTSAPSAIPPYPPDGKHVVVTLIDSTADGGKTPPLAPLHYPGEPFRQLTFGGTDASSERSPQFLPDNSAILFTLTPRRQEYLYRLPLTGGEAIPTKIERTPITVEEVAGKGDEKTASPLL